MAIYRAKYVFFADGLDHPVDLDATYTETHDLVIGYPTAFEVVPVILDLGEGTG